MTKKELEEMYSAWYGDKLMKQIVVVQEKDRFEDEFKDPTAYFIVNGLGDAVYFKTRDRAKAQALSDEMYGKGFYTVKKSMKAAVR